MLGGVSAVIEFAVSSLGVGHIVVCGHSHCGAMQGLLDPASVATMPTVESWLHNAHAALRVAETMHDQSAETLPGHALIDILTEQNVLLQMQHLKTHPSVAGAIARRKLTISGWIYSIGTGEVRIASDGEEKLYADRDKVPNRRLNATDSTLSEFCVRAVLLHQFVVDSEQQKRRNPLAHEQCGVCLLFLRHLERYRSRDGGEGQGQDRRSMVRARCTSR